MSKRKLYICKYCGKKYFSYKENSNYCSLTCKTKDNTCYHNCDYCGKQFKVGKSQYEKYLNGKPEHLYCSRECANLAMKTKVTKQCAWCGKSFSTYKCNDDSRRFCSMDCYNQYRSQMLKMNHYTCTICGKEFDTYHKNQIYCSEKCSSIAQRDRTICTCSYCGKQFERKKSDVKGKQKCYCSLDCRLNDIRWKESDIDILRRYYRKIKTSDIQKMLSKNYSLRAINDKAITCGLAKSRKWTPEEEEIILVYYSNTPMSEIIHMLPNRTFPSILHKAQEFNLMSYFYLNNVYSENEINYLKAHYQELSNEDLSKELHRSISGIEQKLSELGLYRDNEIKKDGYYNLNRFIRAKLSSWKNEVREKYNYTCCLSGARTNIVVHHCRGFNLLMNETIEILDFPQYENFENYSDEQLLQFFETFMNVQEYYNSYVCVTESIHRLFHKKYGYGDNTEEQWDEFSANYKNGYYDNEL